MYDFYSKDREKAWDQIKEELYSRLENRRLYAKQNPLNDQYYKGLQKGALSEIDYLEKLLDILERS
jgi:hypothetical protein